MTTMFMLDALSLIDMFDFVAAFAPRPEGFDPADALTRDEFKAEAHKMVHTFALSAEEATPLEERLIEAHRLIATLEMVVDAGITGPEIFESLVESAIAARLGSRDGKEPIAE